MTRFLNISTDNTLGGLSPSDEFVASQKAIKEYVDNNSSNVQIDDLTITQNANDDIQAVGTINKNTAAGAQNPVYDWVGTYQEWVDQDVAATHPEWVCFITDDSTGGELKANTNLDNLTEDGKNISTWSSNMTNCITHIPQDIKLELNAGTLTLKAGSKLYVPNGAGMFDEVTVASDIIVSAAGGATKYMLFYNKTSSSVWFTELAYQNSGTTPSGDGFYYNISTNKIVFLRSGVADPYEFSFPIGIVTSDSTKYTNIDQVFNGFGYIGSTVFALPGVKGLIPDGRNADGSLKNIEWEADTVYKTYRNWVGTSSQSVQMGPSANNIWNRYIQTEYMPATNDYTLWYKPSENILRLNNTANNYTSEDQWTITTGGIYITSIGPGTNIDPIYYKQPGVCHLLDYTNTEYMCNQAMPSGVNINLTPTNDANYTAPGDGWFVAIGQGSGTNMWIELISDIAQGVYGTIGWQYKVSLAVKKGASCKLSYNNINFVTFKFVYANGAIGWK